MSIKLLVLVVGAIGVLVVAGLVIWGLVALAKRAG